MQRCGVRLKAPTKKPKLAKPVAERALYLYAISQISGRALPIAAEGIDGAAKVEALRCEDYLCWISRVSKRDFVDQLTDHMQNLEWLASAGLRHQRVVAEVSENFEALPARFGTVFLSDKSLAQHVKERKSALREAFERVADADEWGVKIFAVAKAKTPIMVKAASGSDYLKKKAAMLRPTGNKELDEDVREFVSALTKLSVAAAPGGKASAGQPGLVWHGSFLVRRKDRARLESTVKRYADSGAGVRRIDCSGPWPPYSFVEEHVD